MCIVLNPRIGRAERLQWKALLEKWTASDVCPQEDPDLRTPAQGWDNNVSTSYPRIFFLSLGYLETIMNICYISQLHYELRIIAF